MAVAKSDGIKEQVVDLLCGDDDWWTWGGADAGCRFAFDRAGTGSISCGENQRDWFAVEFTWALVVDPVEVNKNTWKCTIQMTYDTRIARQYHNGNHWFKGAAMEKHLQNAPPASEAPFRWAPLRSTAFRPKQFSITISRGRYIEPWHSFIKKPFPLFQFGDNAANRFAPNRYASKLVFDVSPYPPREEWAEDCLSGLSQSLDFQRHWEKKEYVRDWIPRESETWAETLDVRWWLSPAAGEAYKRGMAKRIEISTSGGDMIMPRYRKCVDQLEYQMYLG